MKLEFSLPERARAEDLGSIAALLAAVFPRPRPWARELEWQYLENPAGRAWIVNACVADGKLLGHYAVLPIPPPDDPRLASLSTYLSLNVAVHPECQTPGIMIALTRSLFQRLQSQGPARVLGVANQNAVAGFTKLLGFRSLGRLSLSIHPPWRLPSAGPPRALKLDPQVLRWRVARPAADTFARRSAGAILRRIGHRGMPLDGVLAVDLPRDSVERLALPERPRAFLPFAPRLYASFGDRPGGGLAVPERLRPSPLHYIYRLFGAAELEDQVRDLLSSRRFEFLDFDVM